MSNQSLYGFASQHLSGVKIVRPEIVRLTHNPGLEFDRILYNPHDQDIANIFEPYKGKSSVIIEPSKIVPSRLVAVMLGDTVVRVLDFPDDNQQNS